MDATTTAPRFVAFVAGQELGRYTTKGSANRAARKAAGGEDFEVMTVAALEADEAAFAARQAEIAEAARAEQVAPVDEVPSQPVAMSSSQHALAVEARIKELAAAPARRLAPASKKLSRDQKRALAACVRAAMAEVIGNATACSPLLEDASTDDIRAQVEQWMSYLPKGADAEGDE